MDRCDVLIVGGGPAGSACAWALRDSGLDVVVMDRREFPRDKTCAGWVTPPVLDLLAVDRALYAKDRVLQPIHGFRVGRVGDPESVVRSDDVISYGIRRCEFDHFLLERCEARLHTGEALGSLVRRDGRWIANDCFSAGVVVGAGGHFCPVARRLSEAGPEGEPIVAAQEIEFELDPGDAAASPVDPEVPEIYFTEDLKGYGWVFRKGTYLNVGLGRQDRSRLGDHVERFFTHLKQRGRIPTTLPDRPNGHAYLLYDQAPRRLVDEALLLVGDAAGLAYPRSGEGIRPAVESALLAARRIASGATDFAGYVADLEARLGPRDPGFRVGLTDLLPAPWTRRLAGRLFATPWFARNVVVDRWFTHADLDPLPDPGPVV